ncbi:dihydropteroate synthase [Jatrophihabitans sp. YIM 134969]
MPVGAPVRGGAVVMGVLNVTPDSFSDGGRWASLEAAVAHGVAMHRRGADLIDVGGESTRPGAERVDAETETARVVPVVRELVAAGVTVSVDTTRAAVAAAAVEAGAAVVNDVSGGLADPDMARVVADARVPWILMHWRGHSDRMADLAVYDDVVADVRTELVQRADAALAAGVDPRRLVLDPGLGFAKTAEHNWELLANLDQLLEIGLPVLVGASRKAFLGRLLADPDGRPRPVEQREDATTAVTTYAVLAGAWGVRVHEVGAALDAAAVAARISGAVDDLTGTEPGPA